VELEFLDIISKNPRISNFIKIRRPVMTPELFHTDRRKDRIPDRRTEWQTWRSWQSLFAVLQSGLTTGFHKPQAGSYFYGASHFNARWTAGPLTILLHTKQQRHLRQVARRGLLYHWHLQPIRMNPNKGSLFITLQCIHTKVRLNLSLTLFHGNKEVAIAVNAAKIMFV